MADIATASERLKETAWRRWTIAHGARAFATIRGRILIAFLAMSVITGAVGAYAALGMRHAGTLVARTFDESLISINYARAAAADFAAMQTAFTRRSVASDPGVRTELDPSSTGSASR